MGRRKTLFFSVAAGTALCAVLAACGNSASQPPAPLPAARAATSPSPSASTPSPSPDASASIPADLNINFEQPTTTDPTLLSITADVKSVVYAYEEALARGNADDPLVHTLVTKYADVQITQLLTQLTANKTRPSGTVTFFRVTPSETNGFYGVAFCEDDSKAVPVTVQGDSPKGSAPTGSNALRQWAFSFAKDNTGKLTIDYLSTQAGSRSCG
jgi:hypothetical protein